MTKQELKQLVKESLKEMVNEEVVKPESDGSIHLSSGYISRITVNGKQLLPHQFSFNEGSSHLIINLNLSENQDDDNVRYGDKIDELIDAANALLLKNKQKKVVNHFNPASLHSNVKKMVQNRKNKGKKAMTPTELANTLINAYNSNHGH